MEFRLQEAGGTCPAVAKSMKNISGNMWLRQHEALALWLEVSRVVVCCYDYADT
jgi:hypothetical protein